MAYCKNCGQLIDDKAVVCVHCGVSVQNTAADNPSIGLKVLSFFIPIVGLILYLVKKDQTPVSAKEYGKWALIGFIVGIVFSIIYNVIFVSLMMV